MLHNRFDRMRTPMLMKLCWWSYCTRLQICITLQNSALFLVDLLTYISESIVVFHEPLVLLLGVRTSYWMRFFLSISFWKYNTYNPICFCHYAVEFHLIPTQNMSKWLIRIYVSRFVFIRKDLFWLNKLLKMIPKVSFAVCRLQTTIYQFLF